MQRVFKTRHFIRWMRKTALTDSLLCKAVAEMKQGLQALSHELLARTETQLDAAVRDCVLEEICHDH